MNGHRLKWAKHRLKGNHLFIPEIWLCTEYIPEQYSEEIEDYLKANNPHFICIVESILGEEDDGVFVTYCSDLPSSEDAEIIPISNFLIKQVTGRSWRTIEVLVAEAWDRGENIGNFFHDHPLVQRRIDALLEFLNIHGWVWQIDPEAVRHGKMNNVHNPNAVQKMKNDLIAFSKLPEDKQCRKSDLIRKFFRTHPSNSIEEFEKMLDFVESIGLSTISMPKMRKILKQTKKQNEKCVWCSCQLTVEFESRAKNKATWEHMIPKSEGGRNKPFNYLVACTKCNSSRGNKQISEWFVECLESKKNPQMDLILEFFLDEKKAYKD